MNRKKDVLVRTQNTKITLLYFSRPLSHPLLQIFSLLLFLARSLLCTQKYAFIFYFSLFLPAFSHAKENPASHAIFTEENLARAQKTLETLTRKQKIGQLFIAAAIADRKKNKTLAKQLRYKTKKKELAQYITEHHIGGIIFLGTSTPEKQVEITNFYQECAKKNNLLPLLIAQDLEWGLSMRLESSCAFPRASALGCIQEDKYPNIVYKTAREIGRQAKILGVHLNLAPVLDVNNNPENPIINDRAFGSNPEQVAAKGIAFAHGLLDSGMLCCAKHFPGHGDTNTDSHCALPCIPHTKNHLDSVEILPFKKAVAAQIPAIMSAHLYVPALETSNNRPASLSHAIVTNLLKEELGFAGLVITDGLGMQGVLDNNTPGKIELNALMAGNDLLLCPVDLPKAVERVTEALNIGILSEQELDKRVRKILCAKEWVFAQRNTPEPGAPDLSALYTGDTFALKKQLYQAATQIIHDPEKLLPLKKNTRITLLQIGTPASGELERGLEKKLTLSCHHLSKNPTEKERKNIKKIDTKTIIISCHEMNHCPAKQFGITPKTKQLIEELTEQGKKIILLLFGSVYSAAHLKNIDATIVAHEDEPEAHQATIQLLTDSFPYPTKKNNNQKQAIHVQ